MQLLDWLKIKDNRDAALAVVTIVTALAGGGWFLFDRFIADKSDSASDPEIVVSGNEGSVGVQTGSGTQIVQGDNGTVVIGLSIELHEEILRDRQVQLRADLERASAAEKALLQSEFDAVSDKLLNLEGSYASAVEELRVLRLKLADLHGRVPEVSLVAAQQALFEGDRSKADALLAEIEVETEDSVELAAEAAFLRGTIAEQEVRWADAARHYSRAADLLPSFDHLMEASNLAGLTGDYPRALHYGEALVALARDDGEISETRGATALNQLAITYYATGSYEKAEPLLRRALEIGARTSTDSNPDYAAVLVNLAGLLKATGRYDEAEQFYIQAVEIHRQALGEGHPDYATSINNLAELYRAMSRYSEAEPLYLQALEVFREAHGEDHPAYATSMNNLAELYRAMGHYAEAEPLLREALEIQREALGEDHPDYAVQLNNLGLWLDSRGRHSEAEPLFRQSLEIERKSLGEFHPSYATSLSNLAGLLDTTKRNEEAERLYRQAIEIDRKALGEDHPTYAMRLNNLAVLLEATDRYEEAEPLFLQALEITRLALGEEHPTYAIRLNNLAFLLAATERYDEAGPLYRQATEIFREALGSEHPETLNAQINYATFLISRPD